MVLALAMVAKAKLAKAASGRNPREYNETTARFDFRVALLHGCREYVMVIKGSVKITNGEHSIVLNQGDFLAYDGNLPHSMENVGGKVAELHMTDLVF